MSSDHRPCISASATSGLPRVSVRNDRMRCTTGPPPLGQPLVVRNARRDVKAILGPTRWAANNLKGSECLLLVGFAEHSGESECALAVGKVSYRTHQLCVRLEIGRQHNGLAQK